MELNSVKTLSLLQKIEEFVNEVRRIGNLGIVTSSVRYINKEDETDILINPSFDLVYDRGLDLSKYSKIIIKENSKRLVTSLLSTSEITTNDIEMLKEFVEIAESLVDMKDEFKKKINTINASINKAKSDSNTAKEDELRIKKAQMYVDYNIEPKKSYKDMGIYLQLLAEKMDRDAMKGKIFSTTLLDDEVIMNDFSGK